MPTLFGQMFMATGEPNRFDIPAFFSLHVWLWQDNPCRLVPAVQPDVSRARPDTVGPTSGAQGSRSMLASPASTAPCRRPPGMARAELPDPDCGCDTW